MNLPPETALAEIVERNTVSIDVRAPSEYEPGTVPGAINLPILDDEERAQVGTAYKHEGAEVARQLGYSLVQGEVKTHRVSAWRDCFEQHPEAFVFCWRGGERSAIAQRWLLDTGIEVRRVQGGYKALRQLCLKALDLTNAEASLWWVLAGRTGSGKTELLRELPFAIDLEGLAAHRGSAFGARAEPQPSPATFENHLACELLRHRGQPIVLEDESRTIGRLALPESVHAAMQRSPVVLLDVPFEQRVANIRREYIDEPLFEGREEATLQGQYRAAITRIERRLGGARCREVAAELDRGFITGSHEGWIARLLEWYYDPMYDYQLAKKQARIRFTGDARAVRSYLTERVSDRGRDRVADDDRPRSARSARTGR